jgi:DNA primase catalytic subunit
LIERFYLDVPLRVPSLWNLSRKHFRVKLCEGRFVKLNKFENRLSEKDLRFYCWKLKPLHVYFSVLNWLFPERVGKKYKAKYCVPLNGEYVVDVDSYMMLWKHQHQLDSEWSVCVECLGMAKTLTLQLCEIIKKYYSRLAVVFSGRMGFHVHVLDFDYRDWVSYRERDPIWCHHASRFKLTKLLQKQTHVFDRVHFTVSVDPMRLVTVPNTLNARTGLVCSFIGDAEDLERLTIPEILEKSKDFARAASSPAVVGGMVYVGSYDHNVYCLDALTGTKIWNYTTGDAVH